MAPRYVPQALYEATGEELHSIVRGIIPGLLMFLGVLAASTALGAAAGAAIGALAFGVGAAPGAAIGGELGFEGGIALLEFLGLTILVAYIGKSLWDAARVASDAVRTAWHSVDNSRMQQFEIEHAAKRLAFAVGLVFRGVLQGIVQFLLAKGTAAAASRVPELVSELRQSKLGGAFAAWVERNWQSLIKNPKLQPETGTGPRGAGGETKPAKPAPPSAKDEAPHSADRSENTITELDRIYERAPAAKREIDALADSVAKETGGRVAKAPLKSRARALEKIENDYRGDASKIKDIARNTIVVPAGKEGEALAALQRAQPGSVSKVINPAEDLLGYSGINVTVPTRVGIPAEIQINSPEMIYAKENPEVARSILGDDAYNKIASKPGLPPGGRGHELYEQWRSMPPGPAQQAIEAESRTYYNAFRR